MANRINTGYVVDPSIQQPFTVRSLDFLQDEIGDGIGYVIQSMIGDSYTSANTYVLGGLQPYGTNQYTEGYVYYANKLYYCAGKSTVTAFTNVPVLTLTTTQDALADPLMFTDGIARNVHNINRMVLSDAVSGTGTVDLSACVYFQDTLPKTKRVAIGNWNMDTTATKNVAHGMADFSRILSASVMIISDNSALITELTTNLDNGNVAGGNFLIDATLFQLSRITGGYYDSVAYDTAVFNRGYVNFTYI